MSLGEETKDQDQEHDEMDDAMEKFIKNRLIA